MPIRLPTKYAAVAAVLVLAACNQNKPQQDNSTTLPIAQSPPAPAPSIPPSPPPAAPPPIQPATELPIMSVDSVALNRDPDDPQALIIDANGTVPSTGWTNPKLVPMDDTIDDAGVKTYRFVATSPAEAAVNGTPQTIAAEIRVTPVPAGMKTVRIVAGTNQVSAPIAQ